MPMFSSIAIVIICMLKISSIMGFNVFAESTTYGSFVVELGDEAKIHDLQQAIMDHPCCKIPDILPAGLSIRHAGVIISTKNQMLADIGIGGESKVEFGLQMIEIGLSARYCLRGADSRGHYVIASPDNYGGDGGSSQDDPDDVYFAVPLGCKTFFDVIGSQIRDKLGPGFQTTPFAYTFRVPFGRRELASFLPTVSMPYDSGPIRQYSRFNRLPIVHKNGSHLVHQQWILDGADNLYSPTAFSSNNSISLTIDDIFAPSQIGCRLYNRGAVEYLQVNDVVELQQIEFNSMSEYKPRYFYHWTYNDFSKATRDNKFILVQIRVPKELALIFGSL